MKSLSLLVLAFFVSNAFATAIAKPVMSTIGKDTVYECSQYTKNAVFDDGTTEDNPVQSAVTRVDQTLMGFDIQAGEAFPEARALTNAQMGSVSGVAGDKQTLLVLKTDEGVAPYFLVYLFNKEKVHTDGSPSKGAIVGLVVLANCKTP